jgi:hypothetical protein
VPLQVLVPIPGRVPLFQLSPGDSTATSACSDVLLFEEIVVYYKLTRHVDTFSYGTGDHPILHLKQRCLALPLFIISVPQQHLGHQTVALSSFIGKDL